MTLIRFTVYCFLLATSFSVLAADYELPNDAGALPGSCSASGGVVSCNGNLILGNKDSISITEPVSLSISGDFTFGNGLEVNLDGSPSDMSIDVAGNMNPGNNAIINADLTVSGNINSQNNGALTGDITVTGTLNLGNNSVVEGNITATNVNVSNNVEIVGNIDAQNVNLAQNVLVEGNISSHNVNINGSNTVVDGNINATGTVNNNGTVTGYVNADTINDNSNGIDDDLECDIDTPEGPNTGGCSGVTNISRFRLSHSGSTLTCEKHSVTVYACADSGCGQFQAVTGSVDITLNNGESTTANFNDTSQSIVELSVFPAGTYSLATGDTVGISASNSTVCTPDCSVEALDTGLLFTGEQTHDAGEEFALGVRAVRTNTQTRACEAAVQGTRNVDLTLGCLNPDSCLSPLLVNGESLEPSRTLALEFDINGEANLESVIYNDAGLIQLSASVGVATGAVLEGDSSPFVVKPAKIGFGVYNSEGNANDGESAFTVAETPFRVELTPLAVDGSRTPNFGNEATPHKLTIRDFEIQTFRALDENNTFADGAALINQNAFNVEDSPRRFVNSTIEFNEVGVIHLIAEIEGGDYLGGGNTSDQSDDIGRFIPAYFDVEAPSVQLADATSDFTYFGQETFFLIPPSWNLVPYGAKGAVIDNYKGNENLRYSEALDLAGLGIVSKVDDVSLSLFKEDAQIQLLNDGNSGNDLSPLRIRINDLSLLFQKEAVPISPTPAEYRVELSPAFLTDQDGVCYATQEAPTECTGFSWENSPENDTELLYGRLRLLDNAGDEMEPLAADFVIETFDSVNTVSLFKTNTRDMDTTYSDSWLGNLECQLADSNGSISVSSLDPVSDPVTSGKPSVPLFYQAANQACEANWSVDLTNQGIDYLMFDWDDDGDLENPEAKLYFGRYPGNDRQIYWRELGW